MPQRNTQDIDRKLKKDRSKPYFLLPQFEVPFLARRSNRTGHDLRRSHSENPIPFRSPLKSPTSASAATLRIPGPWSSGTEGRSEELWMNGSPRNQTNRRNEILQSWKDRNGGEISTTERWERRKRGLDQGRDFGGRLQVSPIPPSLSPALFTLLFPPSLSGWWSGPEWNTVRARLVRPGSAWIAYGPVRLDRLLRIDSVNFSVEKTRTSMYRKVSDV